MEVGKELEQIRAEVDVKKLNQKDREVIENKMTTKDWKKTKSPEDLYYWYNKKNEEGVTINKKRKNYVFGFESVYMGNSYEKKFKTKPEVLAFAKAYMKKH